jgi:xylulokinase
MKTMWDQVRAVVPQKDYVRWQMGGDLVSDPTDAQGLGLFDPRRVEYVESLLGDCGLRREHVPEVVAPLSVRGGLSERWGRNLGLPCGTPLVVGATDTAAELVSVGAVMPSTGLVKIASSGTVVAVVATPRPDPRLLTYPHVTPDLWYQLGATNSAGVSYSWLGEVVLGSRSGDSRPVEQQLDQAAARVPPGSEGLMFLPFLAGERTPYWNPDLRGAFLGLSATHGRGHLARAVLEGVACSLRQCSEVLREAGVHVTEPVLTGGALGSSLWCQIAAATLGTPVRRVQPQGPALGAAQLAARSVGLDLKLRPRAHAVRPPRAWLDTYEHVYARYVVAAESIVALATADTPGAGPQSSAEPPTLAQG